VKSNFRVIENRKYMWDGAAYPLESDAARVAETYRKARFDVQVLAEGSEWFLFTRRQATAEPAKG
jgi:hypothetical protein